LDNLTTPEAVQVQLKVRFAEINKTASKQFRAQFQTLNPQHLDDNGNWVGSTNTGGGGGFQEGAIDVGLFNANASIETLIQFLQSKGDLRSLAEPNLITLPSKEASFLAGGEFPYPAVQGGGGNNAVSIVFKEFGIRLKFTPVITRNGQHPPQGGARGVVARLLQSARLRRFTIPSLLTRRANTEVEMKDGQYLAIAGLMNNTLADNMTKIPLLGDIPILGQFFRSKDCAPEPHRADGPGVAQTHSAQRRSRGPTDGRTGEMALERVHEDAAKAAADTTYGEVTEM